MIVISPHMTSRFRDERSSGVAGARLHSGVTLLQRLLLAAAAAGLTTGCRGSMSNGTSADGGSTDGRVVSPGSRAPWCPEIVPEAGSPCTTVPPPSTAADDITACEYGSDPHCTTLAECGGGRWVLSAPVSSCSGNPASCPATPDAGSADMCPLNDNCTYPDGRCACISCIATVCGPRCVDQEAGTQWYCRPWDPFPGCPNPRPLLGTACSDVDAGQYCGDNWGETMVCVGGYWWIPSGGC